MSRVFFLFLVLSLKVYSSEVPNFKDLSKTKNSIFFLSTPRSGTNLISSSLSAITRKPIGWLGRKNRLFTRNTAAREKDPAYNRLELPLVSKSPLFYRTHYNLDALRQIHSDQNKLIFVTRNPRELLLRAFFLTSPTTDCPDPEFIAEFLTYYMSVFQVYDSWCPENRFLIFYEDFIEHSDERLLQILTFIDEAPLFLDDFLRNKQEYTARLLESYTQQHKKNSGGLSSAESPQPIFYSKKMTEETLRYLDECIEKACPLIWEKYLKRFVW
jgi:hypothetical protein